MRCLSSKRKAVRVASATVAGKAGSVYCARHLTAKEDNARQAGVAKRYNIIRRACKSGQLEGQSMNAGFTPDQCRIAREFVSYTFVDMARLWATRDWDEARGRSIERLQTDLTPAPLGYRRSMVAGRQLFFFSHAYRLTTDPIFEDRARRLFADLVHHFWDKTNGGWYFSLSDDNTPHDTTKDLYGHAFIIFGLAHYLAIFSDTDALDWIFQTNELVLRHFTLPGGWFAPSTTRDWALLGRNLEQNPHMHLLEAYLSAFNATRDDAFLKCGAQIMSIYTELLRTRDGSKVDTSKNRVFGVVCRRGWAAGGEALVRDRS
jgi:hypothetical protein